MARYDDLNTKMIVYWAILSIIILIVLLQLLQALCYNMVSWTENKTGRTGSEVGKPEIYKSEQLERLNGYKKEKVEGDRLPAPKEGDPEPKKDVFYINIPIERAQEIILKELSPAPGA